ncbi:MAG: toxin-antitoxin system HicB family antitoxin [Sciscionella sp.]|nr:toxin-antitoxin system HicB family antitoxin [Sciscionella sp.]
MKAIITRVDEELHAKIKAKAAAENRSVNDLVKGLLEAAVEHAESWQERRKRLIAEGKLVVYEPEGPAPGHDELERMSRGWGTAVSEALDWSRGEW